MAIYNKQIEFNREKLIGHYLRRRSILDFIYSIFRILVIIVQNIYCVSSYIVLAWAMLVPISWIRSDLYSRLENYLYNSLLFIVSSWSIAAGLTVVETGDEYKHLIEEPEKYAYDHNLEEKIQTNGHQINPKVSIPNQGSCRTNSELKLKSTETESTTQSILKASDTNLSLIKNSKQSGDRIDLNQINDNLASNTSCFTASNNNNYNDKDFDFKLKRINDTNTDGPKYNLNQRLSTSLKSEQKTPRILLLCNHISTADVPLMMQSFTAFSNQSLLWVLDSQFKLTNFGLVCSSHGDFFIDRNSFSDGSLRDQVLKHPDRNLLVLFPEGGFLRKRLEGSNRYALKNGLPMTKYVTHPRFGAFKDLIDPSVNVTHIVDATLFYDDIRNPLSILDIALGNRKEPVILHHKVYKRSEINPSEEWLRSIWLEKDKLLQQYYEDRASIYKRFEGTMRAVTLDWLKIISVHIFYLLVCYLTVYRLFNATSVTMLRARDLYYSNI